MFLDCDQDKYWTVPRSEPNKAVADANGLWEFFRNDEPVEIAGKVIGVSPPRRVIDL